MLVVVSFDIRSDKRRRHVVKILKQSGVRVQYSVFEHNINPTKLKILKEKILSVIDKDDSVRYYPLCEGCLKKIISQGRPYSKKEESISEGESYALF